MVLFVVMLDIRTEEYAIEGDMEVTEVTEVIEVMDVMEVSRTQIYSTFFCISSCKTLFHTLSNAKNQFQTLYTHYCSKECKEFIYRINTVVKLS